jgi:hypothetical protein
MGTTKAKKAEVADRRAQAITLRIAGMDWQSIADRLGYNSRGAACQDVTRALEANLKEQSQAVDVLRDVETLRLDRLQAAAWPAAVRGDLKSIETVLKVIDRRVKLLGLDMPVRTELTGAGGGPLALSTADPDQLAAIIAATGRLEADRPPNTATSTPVEDDDEDEDGGA